MKRELLFFLIAGAVGFMIDAGGVFILTHLADWHPIPARLPSFLIALTVTFFLNRYLTFKASDVSFKRGAIKYISANAVSQSINFGIYSVLILVSKFFYNVPILALVVGSGVAMVFSFTLAKFWVFKIPK